VTQRVGIGSTTRNLAKGTHKLKFIHLNLVITAACGCACGWSYKLVVASSTQLGDSGRLAELVRCVRGARNHRLPFMCSWVSDAASGVRSPASQLTTIL
jgi:hypothetical protein